MKRDTQHPKHPSDEVLAASVRGDVDMATEDRVSEHVEQCETCRQKLESFASDGHSRERIVSVLRHECEFIHSSSVGGTTENHAIDSADDLAPRASIADFAVTFLEPTDRPGAIGRLGAFEVLSVIGYGGMGIVFRGFQEELNRPVAIKVMSPHLASNPLARKRFLREAQATAAIVHPNVMPILSVSEKSSLPFLVMPFVACHSLQERISSGGPLPIVEVLRIGVQVAAALAAAHKQGLVHRDVKPANILLERGIDRAMLTDFGLARAADDVTVTRSGVIAGTPQYMSPEQARGEPIDARSDLFSFGSVIYAMATGRPPFRGETSYGILRKITDHKHRSMQSVNETLPAWLDTLVDRLLSKQAAERFADAEEVQHILEACLAHVQRPGTPMPSQLVPAKRRFSRAWLWSAAFVGICVIAPAYWFGGDVSTVSIALPPEVPKSLWDDDFDHQVNELSNEIDALATQIDPRATAAPSDHSKH